MSKKTLYIIDGTNFIFRAYFAIQHLSNSKGFPTNAIYGFTSMIMKLFRDEKPEYAVVVFDTGKPSFRNELFAEYKANRKAPPDDLIPQFPYFSQIIRGLSLQVFEHPGVEADDVIGTLAMQMKAAGGDAVIVTGDKDFMQLVEDGDITLLDTMKGKKSGPAEVVEKFGVPAGQVIDILALAGDASDNIPGIRGVGPKTAEKLIQQYVSLENLYQHTDELKGAVAKKVIEGKESAFLSKKLATIRTDVPVELNLEAFKVGKAKRELLEPLFREFEFSSMLADLEPRGDHSKSHYQLITTHSELNALVKKLREVGRFAFDTETTSLNPMQAELVGLSLAWQAGSAAYIPVGHKGLQNDAQLPLKVVLDELRPLLEDSAISKVAQNAKYDLKILQRYGLNVACVTIDTMLASYLLNPAGSHNLDDLSAQHLGKKTITYSDVTGTGKNQKNFSEVDLESACAYAAEDADYTLQLADILTPEVEKSRELSRIFYDIEMPLMRVLTQMEIEGVRLDVRFLEEIGERFQTELADLEKKIYQEATCEFNINSPKQLGDILFGQLKLPGGKKTKTGYSTNVDVLQKLAEKYELPRLILDYRTLAKLKSTYVDALPKLVDSKGRIHTDFMQAVAETGRLSSREPNLQNIPIRTELGRLIRQAFIAEESFELLSADYSQIELRLLAHVTEDESLINAFQKNADVHVTTAASIFGISPEEVSEEQRSAGKTVNFSVIYGQSAYGLSQQLKIHPSMAQEYIEHYFKKYPRVKRYRESALERAKAEGYVETIFGRRRYLPEINSLNTFVRQMAERMGFNAIFQGTAADIIKMAMIAIDEELNGVSKRSRMIIQIHDELIFEVPAEEVEIVTAFVKRKMENIVKLRVPLIVNTAHGKNWAQC